MAQTGEVLTESQLRAMEKAKEEKVALGEIETEHVGYLGSQDTFYVGIHKGVGRLPADLYRYLFSSCTGKTVHIQTADQLSEPPE